MEVHPVDDRAHGVLPHPVADVAPGPVGGGEVAGVLDERLGGSGQIGVAGDEVGTEVGELLDDVARHRPGGHALAGVVRRSVETYRGWLVEGDPARRQLGIGQKAAWRRSSQLLRAARPALHRLLEERPGFIRYLERRQLPPQRLPRPGDLVGTERRSVGGGGVLLGGAAVPDVGLARDERRPAGLGPGGADRLVDGGAVVAVDGPCHPYASNRLGTSSEKVHSVGPSSEIRLSS